MGKEASDNTLGRDDQKVDNTKRITNGFEVSKHFQSFIAIEKAFCLLLAIHIFIIVCYYEISYENEKPVEVLGMHLMGISTSIVAVIANILSYKTYNQLKRVQKKDYEMRNIKECIFNIIVIIFQPIVGLDKTFTKNWNYSQEQYFKFGVNHIFVLFSIFKLGLLIPAFMNTLKYKNPRSSRVCHIYGCENSILYQLKCYFKDEPVKLIVILLFFSITVFTFCFRVCERSVENPSSVFNNIENCIWLVVVTMTSVGYGDYAPQTVFGRIIGVFCVFWGVLTVSIMVLVVVNTFELDQRQNKSLKLIKKLVDKQKIKQAAGQYIFHSINRLWKNKCNQIQEEESHQQRNLKYTLKQMIRLSKTNNSSEMDLSQEMLIHFDRIKYGLENLSENFDAIINSLNNQFFNNMDAMKNNTGSF